MRLWLVLGLLLGACDASTGGGGQLPGNGGGKADAYNWAGDDDYYRDQQDDDNQANDAQDDDDDDQSVNPGANNPEAQENEVEPNDEPAHATFLGSPDCSGDAELGGDDDTDWFSVEIETAGEYVFKTSTDEPTDDEATDTRIELYDADDITTALATDDDSGEGSASRLTYTLEPGFVLIKVYGYTTATRGDYTIAAVFPGTEEEDSDDEDDEEEIVLGPAQDTETESNGIASAADSMGMAPSQIDAILDARDVDWFAFEIDQARTLVIETAPAEGGEESVDTVVEVFGASGTGSLGTDDDGADVSGFSRLTVDLPAAGIYTVRVNGYGESTHGAYTLFID